MTERQREIMRMALIYLSANREDAIESFDGAGPSQVIVNGDTIMIPTENEIDKFLMELQ